MTSRALAVGGIRVNDVEVFNLSAPGAAGDGSSTPAAVTESSTNRLLLVAFGVLVIAVAARAFRRRGRRS